MELEAALHAIDTMIAAMEKGNEAMGDVLAVVKDQGEELADLRELHAGLAQAFHDHLRLDIHGGTPGESVRVLRQP